MKIKRRKMKHIILALVMAAIVLSVVSIWLYVISAREVGGHMKSNSIVFQTLFKPFDTYPFNDDSVLKLYLECYVPESVPPMANQMFMLRHDGGTIRSIYEKVKDEPENSQFDIKLIRERYIVISSNIDGLRYAMIVCASVHGGRLQGEMFDYLPMQGCFFDQDMFIQSLWEIEGENFTTYVPYHLFDDYTLFYLYDFHYDAGLLSKNFNLSHQIGHYYRIYGDIADFRMFYESIATHEIVEENDRLILLGSIYRRSDVGFHSSVTPVDGRTILSFREENGRRYVAYLFEVAD